LCDNRLTYISENKLLIYIFIFYYYIYIVYILLYFTAFYTCKS